MKPYLSALTEAMTELGKRPDAIFIGQAVRYPGTGMHQTLAGVPDEKKVEFPVVENMQMGMSTGLALASYLPVSIYPRINFLLEATSQLVQHLDKLPLMRDGGYAPRVLIRTAVATDRPLNAGPQHLGDYSYAIEFMLSTVKVVRLRRARDIVPAYRAAAEAPHPTILVEYHEHYGS